MNELLERQFDRRPRIAVFGDAMLDEYYEVAAGRISPEFPIPSFRSEVDDPRIVLGGSANVCRQFANFNFDVSLFALTNEKIKGLAGDINMDGCVSSNGVPSKKRFYSEGFPLFRWDVEKSDYGLDRESLAGLTRNIAERVLLSDPFDVVVFSDYDKGLLKSLDDGFMDRLDDSTITIVDPKRSPLRRWKGCSIIKPNASEAFELTGRSDWRLQCECIMRDTGCQAVIITQGGSGVVGNVQGSWFEHRPEFDTKAVSVVGAGDCFMAFLAMCMAHSIDIRKAVKIAFDACSCYTSRPFNSPIHPYNLAGSKFVDPRTLARRDFKLAFSNGCFDILHPGHLELLRFARSKADGLVVALNSDASVGRQNKSHPLVNTLQHRKEMISALDCVDFVVDFDQDTPYELMKVIGPDVLVKGSDWPDPVGSDLVGEVFSFGLLEGHSTTSLIEKIVGMNT